MKYVDIDKLEQVVKDLRYKVNTTPWFLGRFIYEIMLDNAIEKANVATAEKSKRPLNLCFEHQQENGRSHYSYHNCHYCKAIEDGNMDTDRRVVPKGKLYIHLNRRT